MFKKIKQKKCRECGTLFSPFRTTQIICNNIACAIAQGKKLNEKAKAKKERAEKKLNSEQKKAFYDNDRTRQLTLTQSAFNKLRKLQEFKWFSDRNLEPECISCGKKNMDWACGHYKTVGAQGWLRFDVENTFLQCNRYCNKALSGNISGNKNTRGFTQGLIDRFGAERAKEIFDHCEKGNNKKWDCGELIRMRKEFNQEIRDLV
ncbi:recombination protein NinG [Candidatus Babeliales bacterium]|nr:recombination protein NinG [Candidatus Babeliales bacterium]